MTTQLEPSLSLNSVHKFLCTSRATQANVALCRNTSFALQNGLATYGKLPVKLSTLEILQIQTPLNYNKLTSNTTPFSDIPQRDAHSNSPSVQDTPMPMSYYIEVLLSLSKAVKNPTTESKFNLPGRHIDPVLLPKQIPSSNTLSDPKETSKLSSASMVRQPRQKMTLTECARKMERSYRGIARHASEISDTFRELDTSRVHKRERTVTATDTVDQKSTKKGQKLNQLVLLVLGQPLQNLLHFQNSLLNLHGRY
ncbi:uncharacterized protein MELLADRAFT_103940 [Melampsora larici-populina 98AG31]|uniref:Uncharacterized protein n=1 Tax=Melampsora larici-populina (strain 98AG31 / pathotype 3-4-7) TaxID=747676 RepID=F4RD23_MELLP|nr:uncharacterized protein MELLADRAFT_103940 [Melampsora larici-populina 98AG31]EGG09825.1 hypothetical protein MELLADRAFT_103940 [Melampsora larici-populina 98AG31]